MINRENIINCPNCHGKNFKFILNSCDYVSFLDNEVYSLFKCQKCDLVFEKDRPTSGSIGFYYNSNYYSYNTDKSLFYNIKDNIYSFLIKYKFLGNLLLIREGLIYPNNKKSKVLDIGCGDGEALVKLGKMGWDNLYGTEINSNILDTLQDKGIKAYINSDFTSIDFVEKFHLIRMQNVLEHLPNPIEAINKIYSILEDDGFLIITVPNFNSVYRYIFKKYFAALHMPAHFFHFTYPTLKKILLKENFAVIKKTNEGLGGFISSLEILLKVKFNISIGFLSYILMIITIPIDLIINKLGYGPSMTLLIRKNINNGNK